MIEVEAKIKINNPYSVRKEISGFARRIGKEKKVDDYYSLEEGYPKRSLRVRRRKWIYEINFKQRISYSNGVHAKKEVEYRVEDIGWFLSLIKDFGFKRWLRKDKTTELYEIKKNFHIELNYVKKLGWFLEVEYLCNEGSVSRCRKEVLDIVKELGFSEKDLVKDGYTKMLWNLKA